jgi:hypothetical protein
MVWKLSTVVVCLHLLSAQTAPPGANEQWRALSSLEGTWNARTRQAASAIEASGTYTFRKELGGRILARHTSTAGCKGPLDYDCEHSDLLYVYQEIPSQPLKAIYFDNEGHVIHYSISTPAPMSVVFLSDPVGTGPQFRLIYELKGAVMEGKFQMHMPGKTEWTSYLEWSGAKM